MQPVAVPVALALIAGAALGILLDTPARPWLVPLVGGLTVSAWLWWRGRSLIAAATLSFLSAGIALGSHEARRALDPPILAFADGDPVHLEGRLRDDAARAEFGVACTLDVETVERRGRRVAAYGGVRLSIAGSLAPARMPAWTAGRRVRLTATLRRPLPYRNFGLPDQEHRVALRGLRLFGSVKSADLVEVRARGTRVQETAAACRRWTRRILTQTIGVRDPQAAAIVTAVLIGDRAGLDPVVERQLQRAGTYHVLAISGGNIAILAGALLWILSRAGLSPRGRAIGTLTLLLAYATIVVGGSSVARATLAAVIYFVARAFELRSPPLNVIAVTAASMVVTSPLDTLDAGFWLTFLASLAILEQAAGFARALTPRAIERGPGWLQAGLRQAAMLLACTLAAEGVLMPITAFVFGQVTLAGLGLNFVAIPLMTVAQIAGLVTLGASAMHPALAGAPAAVAQVAASGIVQSAELVSLAPWSAWLVVPPPWWLVAVALAGWGGAWYAPHRGWRRAGGAMWLIAMSAIAVSAMPQTPVALPWRDRPCSWPELPTREAGRKPGATVPSGTARPSGVTGLFSARRVLRMTVLDVGQGDATVISLPDGSVWLVDAGGTQAGSRFDIGARIVAPALWAAGVRRLATLVLTHGDLDHIGGAPSVIAALSPAAVWEGGSAQGSAQGTPALVAVREASRTAGAGWQRVSSGVTHRAGDARVLVHHPGATLAPSRARNDDSIVLELRYGAVSIVLPGDIGAPVEAGLAGAFEPAPLRVLKAAHHGSRSSTSARFLSDLRPAVVLVSAGRGNRHGHPDARVIRRIAEAGAELYRTDIDGAVQIDTDGSTLRIVTCSGRERLYVVGAAADAGPRLVQAR